MTFSFPSLDRKNDYSISKQDCLFPISLYFVQIPAKKTQLKVLLTSIFNYNMFISYLNEINRAFVYIAFLKVTFGENLSMGNELAW